jgi:acyl carrier protein
MISSQFSECFARALGIEPQAITDDLAYRAIPQWDSVGHMALVAALEAEYNVMLDTDDIIGMSSVAKAKEILQKYGVTL